MFRFSSTFKAYAAVLVAVLVVNLAIAWLLLSSSGLNPWLG
jgi:hypothetical protein